MTSDQTGEAPAPPAPSPPPATGAAWSPTSLIGVVSKVGPPLTIVTALLIYFGWARANAQSRAMGIDVSLFGYSTRDYVMRSVSTLYLPLLVLCGVGLAWLALHRQVSELGTDPAGRRTLHRAGLWALIGGICVALAALIVGWRLPDRWTLVVPLAIAGGTAVAAYGSYLMSLSSERRGPAPSTSERAMRAVLVGGVITLALFWELSSYATVVGRGYAHRIAQTVGSLPRVTVTSPDPLGVEAPGVTEEAVTIPAGIGTPTIRYRTTGLRLLVSSGGRVFLLSEGWRPGNGVVVVLPDDSTLHWAFSR
jgi:hypothetical protein